MTKPEKKRNLKNIASDFSSAIPELKAKLEKAVFDRSPKASFFH